MIYSPQTSSPDRILKVQKGEANLDHYAVLGNPIHHSKSPAIHHFFAQQTSQRMVYSAILVPEHNLLACILSEFYLHGGKGVNITAPFKQSAFSLVETLSERAKLAQAVNTIKWDANGHCYGDNTDGIGFIRDLVDNNGVNPHAKRVLVLGAGGATLGILGPLLEQRPTEIILANRTESHAKRQAAQFSHLGNISACSLSQLSGVFDVIVNTTTSDLTFFEQLSPTILNNKTFCYDLVYANHQTLFLDWANAMGARRLSDGLGMLIEQAAQSFFIWRDVMPNTQHLLTNKDYFTLYA